MSQLDLARKAEKEKQDYLDRIDRQRTLREPVLDHSDDESWSQILQTHDIAFPSTLPPWTDADTQFMQMSLGETLRADLLTTDNQRINFKQLVSQLRVHKMLYQHFDVLLTPEKEPAWPLYTALEQQLYPWIHPQWSNVFAINKNTTGRGIVMCVGNSQFYFAKRAIQAIRQVFKSHLPIDVFAINDDDLSLNKRQFLETTFEDVRVINIVDRIDPDGTRFDGWSLKPYSVLASGFDEVILMDADVYFFQSPDTLFDDAGYQATGTLFFYDRTLFGDWTLGRFWLNSFLPSVSSLVPRLRWWNFLSAHEQESGVVVINKRQSLLGLLAACKINAKRERDEVTYKYAHGDKETFWIGYEMVQTPYAFVKSYGGVLGGLGDGGDPSRVCGNILHFDANRKPYWWNGGLLRNKNKWSDRYLIFSHYAFGEDWDFDTSCIKETDQIHEFNAQEKDIVQQFITYDKEQSEINDVQ
ncbi:mannosyltransferase putative-domain-containing protein [Chlamydoabsidia padenii]|nr:mannosyltransferase putative-domain-containing protein [Chlamydoabsidia padenii]